MMVLPVDQGDLGIDIFEALNNGKSAKACANDNDAGFADGVWSGVLFYHMPFLGRHLARVKCRSCMGFMRETRGHWCNARRPSRELDCTGLLSKGI